MNVKAILTGSPGTRPRSQRPTDVLGPRTGITAPSDRTSKDDHRDRLAVDLKVFVAHGGRIEQLPGPGTPARRLAMVVGGMSDEPCKHGIKGRCPACEFEKTPPNNRTTRNPKNRNARKKR